MRCTPLLLILCLTATPLPAQVYRDRNTSNETRDEDDRANALMRAQQNAARSQMEAARLKVVKTFEASPEWIDAQKRVKEAQDAYDAAAKPILDGLKAKPEYQQAVQRESDAKASVAAHQQNPATATPERLTTPATQALQAASEVTKMEDAALAADPTVAEHKAKVTEATAASNALIQKRDAAVLADPEWQAAKKQFDSAAVNAAGRR